MTEPMEETWAALRDRGFRIGDIYQASGEGLRVVVDGAELTFDEAKALASAASRSNALHLTHLLADGESQCKIVAYPIAPTRYFAKAIALAYKAMPVDASTIRARTGSEQGAMRDVLDSVEAAFARA